MHDINIYNFIFLQKNIWTERKKKYRYEVLDQFRLILFFNFYAAEKIRRKNEKK